MAAIGVPQKLFVSALLDAGREHEFLKAVLEKVPKDETFKLDVPKKPIVVDATLEEGSTPLFWVLGQTYIPEMPEEFSFAS